MERLEQHSDTLDVGADAFDADDPTTRWSLRGRTTVIGRPNSPLPNGFYRTRAFEQAAPGGQLTPVGDGSAPCCMTH